MPSADDEAIGWELEYARELMRRLGALGVHGALVALVNDVPVVVCQNERAIVPLCNRILAAYAVPGERTLQ